jgi:hypothetical protein
MATVSLLSVHSIIGGSHCCGPEGYDPLGCDAFEVWRTMLLPSSGSKITPSNQLEVSEERTASIFRVKDYSQQPVRSFEERTASIFRLKE